ncbi:response regulator [Limibaculum sp. FT325]|uniref:hybrid sensor histidine kinase/response regulator n=1 Tax=Thermohalobaculum sediminis TaxID=2939436 RepID=UPI0020C15288|nr:PAS domain-containing sensor histidine kinase [Limibaculum sediminis]MCL5775565.1 response regulator [Limibaculum sediminis]
MAQPFRILRMQPELGVAGLGILLIALLWAIGWTWSADGGTPILRLAMMTGGIGLITALVGLAVAGLAARPAGLPDGLPDTDEPAVLAQIGGQVIGANRAMARIAPSGARRVEGMLGAAVETDARMIYRLARGAASIGFAFEEVRARDGGALRYLVASRAGPGAVVWTLVAPETLANVMPASIAGRYETAPFCHAVLQGDRILATNLRFRAIFGPDPRRAIAPLMAEGLPRAGRFLLPHADGSYRLMRAFVVTPGGGASADGIAPPTDLFLFELGNEESARRGSSVGLERIPVAVLQITPEGRVVWLNEAARRMLGGDIPPGCDLAGLVSLRGRPFASLVDEAMIGGLQSTVEMVALRGPEGETFAQISLIRSDIDGAPMLLAVLTDASELRQLEDKFAQSQKMEAVGKLAGGVAHDFNNLLTAINGHCDLLLMGRDASQPDYADLNQIKQNANRAAALVRQLLAFSRKQTLNPALISLREVVSDTLYLLVRLIGDRVHLALDHARDGDACHVRADRQQVEQALMNLVVNARDAMPSGGTVTISTRRRDFFLDEARQDTVIPRGAYVELAVADEGTGIEESVIGKVFDPFFTTKPQGEGTGLGLSTVYGIVKQSGGFVFAENRAEGGACFRILLPQADAGAEAPAPEPAVAKPDLTGQGAVLLVEDEASVRSVAARALTLRGYRVTAVDSARDALALVAQPDHPIDLVVSDVMMPGMDGPSFAAGARAIRPGLRVLFISGYAEEAFRRSMDDPDYAFLAKPFTIAELTAKVKEVLAERAAPSREPHPHAPRD